MKVTPTDEKRLVIAYASGYEHGHHDTVEGCFCGDGRSEMHDSGAFEWLQEALLDGTFDRCLSTKSGERFLPSTSHKGEGE